MSNQFFRDQCKKALGRLKVADLGSVAADLEAWAESDFGRYIRHHEHRILKQKYSTLPGYRLLQLGLAPDMQSLDYFSHMHRFSINAAPASGIAAVGNYAELPLPADTIDLALIQHGVEFSKSPKAVLAEVGRVVAPGGHLLLCMYNPYGPHGALKFPMQLLSGKPQYRFHNLRKGRVIDWLSLLNFQVLEISYGAYNPPFKDRQWEEQDSIWEKFSRKVRFPLGNFYMIHAVKRVARGISPRTFWGKASAKNHLAGSGQHTTSIRKNNTQPPQETL
jgi:SAM-dependent methyltransferase